MLNNLEYGKMRWKEVKDCADLAARAFFSYDYFTLFFVDEDERMAYLRTIISSEYRANFGAAHLLVFRENGALVAVAQLHSPNYTKPSDLKYLLSGFTKIYKTADRKAIDDWLEMDSQAARPCHEHEKSAWYLSSLVVDPEYQHQHYGRRVIEDGVIPYVKAHGGNRMSLFTNSEGNCKFYEKLGFDCFHSTKIVYNNRDMGSWSYVKNL